MKLDEKKLLELKEQIQLFKEELAELKGRKKMIDQSLEKEFDCKTIDQAEKKLLQKKQELEKINSQIQEGLTKLQEKYEFD